MERLITAYKEGLKGLEENDFKMNDLKGITLLNISPDKTLLQSSTKSKKMEIYLYMEFTGIFVGFNPIFLRLV